MYCLLGTPLFIGFHNTCGSTMAFSMQRGLPMEEIDAIHYEVEDSHYQGSIFGSYQELMELWGSKEILPDEIFLNVTL